MGDKAALAPAIEQRQERPRSPSFHRVSFQDGTVFLLPLDQPLVLRLISGPLGFGKLPKASDRPALLHRPTST